jgi:hypothetical protein
MRLRIRKSTSFIGAVEAVATELENRRRENWGPTKAIIEELFDIATQLKVLDKKS